MFQSSVMGNSGGGGSQVVFIVTPNGGPATALLLDSTNNTATCTPVSVVQCTTVPSTPHPPNMDSPIFTIYNAATMTMPENPLMASSGQAQQLGFSGSGNNMTTWSIPQASINLMNSSAARPNHVQVMNVTSPSSDLPLFTIFNPPTAPSTLSSPREEPLGGSGVSRTQESSFQSGYQQAMGLVAHHAESLNHGTGWMESSVCGPPPTLSPPPLPSISQQAAHPPARVTPHAALPSRPSASATPATDGGASAKQMESSGEGGRPVSDDLTMEAPDTSPSEGSQRRMASSGHSTSGWRTSFESVRVRRGDNDRRRKDIQQKIKDWVPPPARRPGKSQSTSEQS